MSGGVRLGALRPSHAPWDLAPALRALGAAGLVAGACAAIGGPAAVGIAYFGAACGVMFVKAGSYRSRLAGVVGQGAGAVAGIAIGAASEPLAWVMVLVAVVAGAVSGMVGAIGPASTAFALMLVIGVGFGQFSGLGVPWWQMDLWYLAGTCVVLVATLAPWVADRGRFEREAVAGVFDASAALAAVIGTEDAPAARRRLAAASAASRSAVSDYRMRGRARSGTLEEAAGSARLTASAVASLYGEGLSVPPVAVEALRATASDVRDGLSGSHADEVRAIAHEDPSLAALADALDAEAPGTASSSVAAPGLAERVRRAARSATDRVALLSGLRLALCMGVATVVTLSLHDQSHSYWLPLTVAVVVRPEYASVFVRTVNRITGTVAGALVAAVVLLVAPESWPIAVVAALSIGFAVLAAPKLYALSVIGITASALLAASIGAPDPVYPLLRGLDTIIGCAIAIVFGYLLWPGSRRLPAAARLEGAAASAERYLRAVTAVGTGAAERQRAQDEAYRRAHRARAAVDAALSDPPPVSKRAAAVAPAAIALEDIVDDVTALETEIAGGERAPTPAELASIVSWIRALGAVGSPPRDEERSPAPPPPSGEMPARATALARIVSTARAATPQ